MFIVPIKPLESMDFSKLGGQAPTPEETTPGGLPFADILQSASETLSQVQATAEADSYQLAFGNVDNLAQVQINSMKAEAMLNTAVQLTSRTVNAYKEIMQMQV